MPKEPNPTPDPDTTPESSSAAPSGTESKTGTEPKIELTAEQLQQTIQQAVTAAMASQPRPEPAAPEPEPAQPPAADPFSGQRDDDLVEVRTMRGLYKDLEARLGNMGLGMQHLYGQGLSQLELLSRQAEPNVWEKYSDEIQKIVGDLKNTKVLDASDYQNAVAIVKGRHVEDFAEERARQIIENAPPADVSGETTPIGGGGIESEHEIPERWKKMLEDNGLTLQHIKDRLAVQQQQYGYAPSLEKYLGMMEKQELIRDDKGYTTLDLTEGK